jgi:hypothetical protein
MGEYPKLLRSRHRDMGSRLVWLGGVLILLAAGTPPLQGLLAFFELITVVTYLDTPVYGCNLGVVSEVGGYDPELLDT